MKKLSLLFFIFNLIILLWLILFKSSFDIVSILIDHQSRSLNLIPFADSLQGNVSEMISNFIVFIPLGLLLSINFKRLGLWVKLACVFGFSLVAEIMQFILAIGTTDITDVITNTLGGLMGLLFYDAAKKHIDQQKMDQWIIVACVLLFVILLALRLFVFRVRY